MEQTDKGVPPPMPRRGHTVPDRLGVGDIVLLGSATTDRIGPALAYGEARDGKKSASRKGQGKVRAWRTR